MSPVSELVSDKSSPFGPIRVGRLVTAEPLAPDQDFEVARKEMEKVQGQVQKLAAHVETLFGECSNLIKEVGKDHHALR